MNTKPISNCIRRIIILFSASVLLVFVNGCATSSTLSQIEDGHRYTATGQYEKALVSYENTLKAAPESLAGDYFIAAAQNNIGAVYMEMGQYDMAMKYFNLSMDNTNKIKTETNKKEALAANLNNIGFLKLITKDYDQAIKYCTEALAINRKMKRNKGIACNLSQLGFIYQILGQYEKAINYYEEALRFAKNPDWGSSMDIGKYLKILVAQCNYNLGSTYYDQGKYREAIEYLEQGLLEIRQLRSKLKAEDRYDYEVVTKNIYQLLSSSYFRIGDKLNVYRTVETNRCRILAERINMSEADLDVPSIEMIQREINNDTAILIYANTDMKNFIFMKITKSDFVVKEISSQSLLLPIINKYDSVINEVSVKNKAGKFAKRETASSIKILNRENDALEKVVGYYHSLISDSSSLNERGIKLKYKDIRQVNKYTRHSMDDLKKISRSLYDLLIQPNEKYTKKIQKLIIIPDGILSFLPYESLLDRRGKYLIENYSTKYIQSISVWNAVKKRQYDSARKNLIAFGGAIYEDITCSENKINNVRQLEALTNGLRRKFETGNSVREAYCALDYQWDDLPGTVDEVKSLSSLFRDTKVMIGDEVSENNIKKLSQNGVLPQYKVLHFATHGLVVPLIPELSAVILSQYKEERGGEDGYLRMEEIAKLSLKADFVNLSACDTGLGKIYGSEGVVSLTQAFFIAGANSVSSSLWSVADISTSNFMAAMYGNVYGANMEYSEAIIDTKRRFLRGEFGTEYKDPFFWAPFVYYGR